MHRISVISYILLWASPLLLFSCQSRTPLLLEQAAQTVKQNPTQADSLLHLINASKLNESDYHYFILLQTHAWDKRELSIISADSIIQKAKAYFTQKQDAPNAAFACFMEGRIFEAQERFLFALQSYQAADKWTEKTNQKLLAINYSAIPYNIAYMLYVSGQHEQALPYLDKALQLLQQEPNNAANILYAIELKASNYEELGINDSAVVCYNKALRMVDSLTDPISKNRINYNFSIFLYNNHNDVFAKEKCLQTLANTAPTDSINKGRLYFVLAAIYDRNKQTDSAYIAIYKAKNLLPHADYATQKFLYEALIVIETKKGNIQKAAIYQQELDRLTTQHQQAQHSEAAQLQALLKQEQEEKITAILHLTETMHNEMGEQKRTTRLMVVALFLVASISGVLLYRNKKMEQRNDLFIAEIHHRGDEIKRGRNEIDRLQYREKKASIRHIFHGRDLIKLIEWVQEHYPKDEQRKDLVHSIEKIRFNSPWDMHDYYKAMFYEIGVAFPTLSETEYRILCLSCTEMMTSDEIANFLHIDFDAFEEAKHNMEDKVLKTNIGEQDISLLGERAYAALLLSCIKRANPKLNIVDISVFFPFQSMM